MQRGLHGLQTSPVSWLGEKELCRPEAATEKQGKHFLQGLKPIHAERFTPGLKPRPPRESDIFRNLQILAPTKPEEFTRCLPVAEIGYSG